MRIAVLSGTLALLAGCSDEDEFPETGYLIIRNAGTEEVTVIARSYGFVTLRDSLRRGEEWSAGFSVEDLTEDVRVTVVRNSDGYILFYVKLEIGHFTEPGDSLTITVYP